jgi:catechol 2,3-dioxygenase-like lactoylglutathione lyase family enzyme
MGSSSVATSASGGANQGDTIMETSRVQLALNVSDIDAATHFYTQMFGVGPAKQRTGYANFEIADPPLKLVLFEHAAATSPLNHLGVEVPSTADVVAAAERFTLAGLTHRMAESDRCCHAVQDKVWVDAPDVPLGGWEVYTVLADDPDQDGRSSDSVCCTSTSSDSAPCCAGTPDGSE